MATKLQIGDLSVEVTQKDIKNVHLSVHPPLGRVSIAAPRHLSISAIRAFAIGKLSWIRQQQRKLEVQERETPREYLDRESHYVWGRRCLLKIVERDSPPMVEWRHNKLILTVRPGMDADRRAEVVEAWYRDQLREEVKPLMADWERRLGVRVNRVFIQRMKTRWGSCNPISHAIRLNTDLAKKPRECLEYILVHELVHLLEPTHNSHFVALMNQFLPGWEHRRDQLNRLPVRHADWDY
ncbi:M48 family metallopeptidase [Muricoccus vinaceus]|uniref:M48 family metallopeptidase n=1 Tax=Muricoccus vinaceus TaxID=424704 RepID=A0ABV6ITB0_9PROT